MYGTRSPRACRCCGTEERSIGILHSGNPSCVEGGDVEQVCSNLETYPCVCDCYSLSLFVSCYILHVIYCVHLYMHDIFLVLIIDIYTCVGLFANTCIQPREPTRHLSLFKGNLEEFVQSPSRGIRQHSCVIHSV